MLSIIQRTNQLDALVSIALDLTSATGAEERYRRLLEALRHVIPYDASALLRLQGKELVPVVSAGLSADAMGRRFALSEHPRLEIICNSPGPVLFPADSRLPDPFDGLLADERGEFRRVGSEKLIKTDVRIIAATNRDLEQEVKTGQFRADLFHRLCVYPLRVPPLRERAGDIPFLAGYLCDLTRRRLGLGPIRFGAQVLDSLKAYHWPGNVRELENLLSRAVLKAAARVPRGESVVVEPSHLGADFTAEATAGQPHGPSPVERQTAEKLCLKEATQQFQRSLIEHTLSEHNGNWAAAARSLGMHRSNLHHLAVRLGLK